MFGKYITSSGKTDIIINTISKEKTKGIMALNNLFKEISPTSATTNIAGPKGGTKEKPVGLVYVGLKRGNKIQFWVSF